MGDGIMAKKKNSVEQYLILIIVLVCVIFIGVGIRNNLAAELESQNQAFSTPTQVIPTPTNDI